MKNKILVSLLCLLPCIANAAIPYRVEQTITPVEIEPGTTNDDEAFARVRRFYVGGSYDFSIWNDVAGGNVQRMANGKNTSSFEAMIGIRLYDTFRLEANYIKTEAKWNMLVPTPASGSEFALSGDIVMTNAIFDARIDSIYRAFRKQMLVPYVGIGGGVSMNNATGAAVDNKNTPVAAVMAGLGIEFGGRLALDFGYRYLYMFSPRFDVAGNFDPAAHQFRAGARVNF
ncbi:MAG: porin family protein [Rickettsiales bacterium]|jgi:opacity protein-like surface antigen|nr:porin family protein [Rickettsiales bacterium]